MGNEGCEATDEFTLSSLEVLQWFSFFLQMGFTLILATLDGLGVGLLEDVIGKDNCDDDDCDEEMSLVRIGLVAGCGGWEESLGGGDMEFRLTFDVGDDERGDDAESHWVMGLLGGDEQMKEHDIVMELNNSLEI
ncbi:hypothetical protein Tco_1313818 [Tanacetum coccineum]